MPTNIFAFFSALKYVRVGLKKKMCTTSQHGTHMNTIAVLSGVLCCFMALHCRWRKKQQVSLAELLSVVCSETIFNDNDVQADVVVWVFQHGTASIQNCQSTEVNLA